MSTDFTTPELPAAGIMEPLGEDDRRLLSSYGEFLPVQIGAKLISEGQAQDSLFFVISGKLHASVVQEGRDVLLGRIGPGETIGEVNMFDPTEASATVKALEFSQVWRIDRASLEDFMNESSLPAAHLLIGISTTLSRRLRQTNERFALHSGSSLLTADEDQ